MALEFVNQIKEQNLGIMFKTMVKQVKMIENQQNKLIEGFSTSQIFSPVKQHPNSDGSKLFQMESKHLMTENDHSRARSSINQVNNSVNRFGGGRKSVIPNMQHSFIGGNRIGSKKSPTKKTRSSMGIDMERERQNAKDFKNVNAILNADDEDYGYEDMMNTDENPDGLNLGGSYVN